MAGISPISAGGAGLSASQIQSQYDAKVAVTIKDAINEQGQNAVKLIQSAAVNGPAVGGAIDVQA